MCFLYINLRSAKSENLNMCVFVVTSQQQLTPVRSDKRDNDLMCHMFSTHKSMFQMNFVFKIHRQAHKQ